MELKHGAPEFAIPSKPTTLELRRRHDSRRLRLCRHGNRRGGGEGISAGSFGGDIEGEEIRGGRIDRSAMESGERNLVAENGIGFRFGFEMLGKREGSESFVDEGFWNLRRFVIIFHWRVEQ